MIKLRWVIKVMRPVITQNILVDEATTISLGKVFQLFTMQLVKDLGSNIGTNM